MPSFYYDNFINYIDIINPSNLITMEPISVKVLYFASVREQLGNIQEEKYAIEKEITTLKQLVEEIKNKHKDNEGFKELLDRSMIAVDDEYQYELGTIVLKGNEEVAIIPPISGG